jgi:nicotinamide-nucleotide amidase
MKEPLVELLTIGREILDGRVIDTNAVKIAEHLRPLGLVPRFAQRVDDDPGRIDEAFRIAASRADVILVTGGLGPTSDDLTAECFAHFLGETPVLRPDALAQIEAYLARFSRPMLEAQRKQAVLPPSCFLLPNPEGTAPGFGLERDGRGWYFMPGVPREMLRMLREQVVPRLPRCEGYRTRTWITQFTPESLLQTRLTPVERDAKPEFEVTYQTRFPENHVGLIGVCATPEAFARFDALAARITATLGEDAYWIADRPEDMRELEAVTVPALAAAGVRVALRERLTGGELAARLSAVSEASRVFAGGEVGVEPLISAGGIAEADLAGLSASARAARARLRGAEPGARAAWGLALDGDLASQRGWIALATNDGEPRVEEVVSRIAVDLGHFRRLMTQKALEMLRRATRLNAPLG